EKGLDAEALFIPATGCLCSGPIPDHIPRLLIPLGPTTQPQDGTIRLSGAVDLLQLDQPARLETRAERLQAAGRTLPRRPGPRGRATRVGPARLLQPLLESRPIACAIASPRPRRPCWDQPAAQVDQGDRERCGQVALRGLAHAPGQRQGAPC